MTYPPRISQKMDDVLHRLWCALKGMLNADDTNVSLRADHLLWSQRFKHGSFFSPFILYMHEGELKIICTLFILKLRLAALSCRRFPIKTTVSPVTGVQAWMCYISASVAAVRVIMDAPLMICMKEEQRAMIYLFFCVRWVLNQLIEEHQQKCLDTVSANKIKWQSME